MNAPILQSDLTTTAALSDLYLHGFNPRQDHSDEDSRAMATSIAVNGLLQNLSGYTDPERDGIGIVAGGRRLAGLHYLSTHADEFEELLVIDFDNIPVLVTADADLARSWAGTEAATQKPLHPADEIRAYAAMVDTGADAKAIARAFGCTKRHVQKRLKLSDLPDDTLQALRSDKITLEDATALTLCNSEDEHTKFLDAALNGAWNLRHSIVQNRVLSTDRRAMYVTRELYELEGGKVTEDLFEDHDYFEDEALLDRLLMDKLGVAAERIKQDRGFAEVRPLPTPYLDWQETEGLRHAPRIPAPLTAADQKDYDLLSGLQDDGDELTSEEWERFEDLEEKRRGSCSDEDIANGIAFAFADYFGTFKCVGPYVTVAGATGASSDTAAKVAEKPPLTQTGIDDLNKIATVALQTKLLGETELVLDLLAFQLSQDLYAHSGPFNVSTTTTDVTPSATDEVRIDARITEGGVDPLNLPPAEAFADFRTKGKKHRNKVLVEALVRCLNRPNFSPTNAALMQLLDVSPRNVWTPTADNHFKACRPAILDSIWRELSGIEGDDDPDMKSFVKLTKAKKAAELEALFNDASVQEARGLSRDQVAAIDRWLPETLKPADTK